MLVEIEDVRQDERGLFAGVYTCTLGATSAENTEWQKIGKGYVGLRLQPVRANKMPRCPLLSKLTGIFCFVLLV
jgi:hypothetical protein